MMLGDHNENVRNVRVAKVLAPRKQVAEENAKSMLKVKTKSLRVSCRSEQTCF